MILVTGGTGFIGKHLLAQISQPQGLCIKVLTRNKQSSLHSNNSMQYVLGDISDVDTLDSFIESGATLINLAHANIASAKDAIDDTKRLVEKCAECGIRRFIHCSSISVYGRVSGLVREETPCLPNDEYGEIKLAIEQTLLENVRGRFELIILRPVEVFGEGGRGLVKLTKSLLKGNALMNYLKSSLYGYRRMHLVPVETVVDVIQFFIKDTRKHDAEIFIISADNDPSNNFRAVERLILSKIGRGQYPLAPLPLPSVFLEWLLTFSGRATVDSQVLYSSEKLHKWGFVNNHSLENSIMRFVDRFPKIDMQRNH